jgi:serine/threonine protein kinase
MNDSESLEASERKPQEDIAPEDSKAVVPKADLRFHKVGSGVYGVVYRVDQAFATKHLPNIDYPLVCKSIEHYSADSMAVMHDSAILEILCNRCLHETGFESPSTIRYVHTEVAQRETKLYMREYKYSLDQYMHHFQLTPSNVRRIMFRAIQGIYSMHTQGLIHRDIKPANIFLDNCDTLVLGDYGFTAFAKNVNASSQSNNIIQALPYRAPEIFLGKECYGAEIDMWSLGCIMFELLAKRPLLTGTDEDPDGFMKQLFALVGMPRSEALKSLKGYAKLESFGLSDVGTGFNVMEHDTHTLLHALLTLDPLDRITAAGALNHPYFKRYKLPSMAPIDVGGMLMKQVPVFSLPSYVVPKGAIVFSEPNRLKIFRMLRDGVKHFDLPVEDYFFCCDVADLYFMVDTIDPVEIGCFVYACLYFAVALCDNAALTPDFDLERQRKSPTTLLEMQLKILKALGSNLCFTSLISLVRRAAADENCHHLGGPMITTLQKVVSSYKLRFYPLEAVAEALVIEQLRPSKRHGNKNQEAEELTSIIKSMTVKL